VNELEKAEAATKGHQYFLDTIESLRAQLAEAEGDRDTWHATSDRDLVKTMAADAKLRAVREIYAGMEGFIPQTAPEGYCLRIIREMYEAVKEPK